MSYDDYGLMLSPEGLAAVERFAKFCEIMDRAYAELLTGIDVKVMEAMTAAGEDATNTYLALLRVHQICYTLESKTRRAMEQHKRLW